MGRPNERPWPVEWLRQVRRLPFFLYSQCDVGFRDPGPLAVDGLERVGGCSYR